MPKYNNVKALNREVKVHIDNNGKVVLVNGELNKPSLQPKNNVTLTQQQALPKAFAAVGIKHSLASNPNGVNPV
ncbi:hypothetical protein [Macrococcus armenti]|uniref:hypothetical protein n=1 Tax=Macrococcus armenti TaxID=2875764 RepID=UPI001CCB0DF4|nr:hypothetical protein LAU41_10745 [Macrococcus armenti]UBH12078.1 hypothetical protein LAU38_10945 [Macrococcus armenti]